ncbi:hypothetical protein LSAT2_003644 [Lamellibrachia satsuma]|nr:hypothetical protein LSAT2_003644 [Lamellibrachia satsuma]
MFTKLKQKLNVEVANPMDVAGDRTVKVHGPGLASPVSAECQSLQFPGASKETSLARDTTDSATGSSPTSSQHGYENGERNEATSKEEVLGMLIKRTDQVKKLETRVTELAAIIRERNKIIEKLEKEQQASGERIKELCHQKDEESKVRSDLGKAEQQLKKANEELGQCQAELLQKTEQEEMKEEKVGQLGCEVISLLERITQLTVISEQLEEENKHKSRKIEECERTQEVLRKTAQEIEEKLALKSSEHMCVEKALAEIQDQYNILQRNGDLHQRKGLTTLLSEKEDHISHLQERAQTLEQRLQDGNLSGDDRVTALEKERDTLELKLTETREQLTQVKCSWSDKITTLENQISNLNEKITEDNEELLLCETSAEHMKERLQQQIVQLESHLEQSEKEWSARADSADEVLRELEKQKRELEAALDHEKRRCEEAELGMQEKVAALESQCALLQKGKELAKVTAREKIICLEQKQEECLEKEIDMERKLTILEEELDQLKINKKQLDEEKSELVDELKMNRQRENQLSQQVDQLTSELERTREAVTSHRDCLTSVQVELQQCVRDKDTLLLRNAQLFQELESAKRVQTDVCGELKRDGQQKDAAITELQQQLQELQTQAATHKGRVTELENQLELAQGALQSAEVEKLQADISALENQLVEKNKIIKQQQQRLNDLKKLLQRELKVQTMPSEQSTMTGGTTCANSRTKDILPAVHGSTTQLNELQTRHQVAPVQPDVSALHSSVAQLPNWSQNNAAFTSSMMTPSSLVSSKSTLACDSCHRPYCDELDGEDYITDTNFQYLRHVVLKFMLSRETEALQLIKAVSMLLKFTVEEEQLLHETLEWRMSWFGPRPKVGKGHKTKKVPS